MLAQSAYSIWLLYDWVKEIFVDENSTVRAILEKGLSA